MNARVEVSKLCPVCGKLMLSSTYLATNDFHRANTCSQKCGQAIRYSHDENLAKLLAYPIEEGEEMTLEEIAAVAGITRERVRQIEQSAFRKLARLVAVMRLRKDSEG